MTIQRIRICMYILMFCLILLIIKFPKSIFLPGDQKQAESLSEFKQKANAVIVILCRNSEMLQMKATLQNFEYFFNQKYKYPYLFLNDEEFTLEFKREMLSVIPPETFFEFDTVPFEHWSIPSWMDEAKVEESFKRQQSQGVLYGGMKSYHLMCRYFSGFFYKHPKIQKYEYYWRIEPGVRYSSYMEYDPFVLMKNLGKLYGWVISITEIPSTIPTLWKTITNAYAPITNNLFSFFKTPSGDYNGCHFWSNFEIASLHFYQTREYEDYFQMLDRAGGFFMERWGDAPVHSLAVGLFLRKDQVHYFRDIEYYHPPLRHCPLGRCLEDVSGGFCHKRWLEFDE